jgi:hypothetical protein
MGRGHRKISYKDRLRILRNLRADHPFFGTKAEQPLLESLRAKMAVTMCVAASRSSSAA